MSALAGNSTSPLWQNMEGNTVNAVFPLLRFLGGSDHSGVFLTQVAGRTPAEVALKLVPLIPTFAELQLSRWNSVAGLAHPHLLGLSEAGRCEIGGMPYLYAVIERADLSLADLLKNRALTDDEARETLLPALSALAYLHDQKLVHGQVKPSNVLVVGDQLKLASDTVHPVAEYSAGVNGTSVYDAPEARNGNSSTAGDIWALGVTMCEALTLQQPSGLRPGTGEMVLPPEMPPAFREIVASCLRRRPEDRPRLAELREWLGGEPVEPGAAALPATAAVAVATAGAPSVPDATSAATAGETAAATEAAAPSAPAAEKVAAAAEATGPQALATGETNQPSSFKLTIRAELIPEDGPFTAEPLKPRWRVLPLFLAAVAVLALVWIGIRVFKSDKTPAPTAAAIPAEPTTPDATRAAASDTPPSQPITAVAAAPAPVEASPTATPAATHEVIPDVPQSALNTIRGTIRVTVRVILDKQGAVIAASADDPGPSPYFARKALGAAKQWTFPASDSEARRVMAVRFAFKRSGTTARVTTPR